MSAPRCRDLDYIQSLIASPRTVTGTEAARVPPDRRDAPAHDAFSRLLYRPGPDPEAPWQEARPPVHRGGVLIVDDSTLDKPYAEKVELVGRHRSGKHRAVVRGINLISLVWSDGDRHIPRDDRIYDEARDGRTKNDHVGEVLAAAAARGFRPTCLLFDMGYAGLENLEAVRDLGRTRPTQPKCNRNVNPDGTGLRPVSAAAITAAGTVVHLEGHGLVRVSKIVARDGDIESWATNDLGMDELGRLASAERTWAIEEYHRGLKQ
ncbi:MAG TPA: IS701 family transposase, partial [Isosphaeraceae bacterium]|nr:IS701 family transposase [Isosphaeraceae bacterium]